MFPDPSDDLIQEMSEQYRKVRKLVYEKATLPTIKSEVEHQQNKAKLRDSITNVCNTASLSLYEGTKKEVAYKIWHHLWSKNRYAGIKAATASREIHDIANIFDDFELFSNSSWDLEIESQLVWNEKKKKHTRRFVVVRGGSHVHDFLKRTGDFKGACTVGNLPKLRTIIRVARKLKEFMENKPAITPPLHFVTSGISHSDVWAIHDNLINEIGYGGELTTLHFMMDLGFQVMKPDIVISSLFQSWGWLREILPGDLSKSDLRKNYTKPRMYKPIINLSRRIAEATNQNDSRTDIGWVTNNPLREFDLFIVKYGQEPEKDYGIIRKLHDSSDTIVSTWANR